MNGMNLMKKTLVGLMGLLAVLTYAPGAFALSNTEIQQQVQDILMERHPTDTPDWWRSLGANAPGVIMSMYEHTSHTYHRIRLLQGLGWFNTPEVADFLKKQAEDSTDDVLRNTAIRSVGFSQGVREEDFIAKYLSHSDPDTRYTAADVLKSLKDPRADALVEKYLQEEKVPWISAKLKGELPRPTAMLTPVATSEDRLNPEFAGVWKGFWVLPRKPSEEGMKTEAATATIQLEGPTDLRAEVVSIRGGKGQTWKLDRVAGKGSKISGVIVRVLAPTKDSKGAPKKATPGSEPIPFEAELTQEAGHTLLEIHARKLGAFLILRKKSG